MRSLFGQSLPAQNLCCCIRLRHRYYRHPHLSDSCYRINRSISSGDSIIALLEGAEGISFERQSDGGWASTAAEAGSGSRVGSAEGSRNRKQGADISQQQKCQQQGVRSRGRSPTTGGWRSGGESGGGGDGGRAGVRR